MTDITVVIPTWRREAVLVDTLRAVLPLLRPRDELLVADQTALHEPSTVEALQAWELAGAMRRIVLRRPSIPRAMNAGLLAARSPVVLFLDDDIIPEPGLLEAHRAAHAGGAAALVAGRVVQPWDKVGAGGASGSPAHGDRPFLSARGGCIAEFMGGNFSVVRDAALALGGFDENFVKAAYRFEKEFSDRLLAAGQRIRYEPAAGIEHLKAGSGGTRAYGAHWHNPGHAVGEYYFLLRAGREPRVAAKILARPLRSVRTRYHLRRPWMIPATLAAEALALLWAAALRLRGPRLIARPQRSAAGG